MFRSLWKPIPRSGRLVAAFALVILASCGGGEEALTPAPGTTIPAAPTTLAATAANASASLTWTASSGATGYKVKRATTNGGPYSQVAEPTAPSYSDTALTNGTTYYYVVSATNSAGESSNSAQASATPAAAGTLPAAPSGLVATAGNATIALSWTSVSGATGYRVKRATVSGGPYAQIGTPTATTFGDTGLANGTTYYYVVTSANTIGESPNSAPASATPATPAAANVTVTVSAGVTHAISPYIYGANGATNPGTFPAGTPSALPSGLTLDRGGGNRLTAYNWENNASNAGSDYLYQNDNLISSSTTAAEPIVGAITGARSAGMASLITVQMQGLVAADTTGPVSLVLAPILSRFKRVVFQKSSESAATFTLNPITTDANVYMDEFVWAVNQRFPGQGIFSASPTGKPVFVSLDNEPELWNSTHEEIQGPTAVTSDTYISKTIALASALKAEFPQMVVFGPAHYGFNGLFSWNGELGATASGTDWFTDKYLAAIKSASTAASKPLVDVYDIHWYSEATDSGGNRVTNLNGPNLTDSQIQAIVQSPRSLWDVTYKENSWVANVMDWPSGGPIYILPRLQAKIAARNPGMKIAITEYNNGGAQHIAGTIAQADNLGVFGAQGIFAATLWALEGNEPYLLAGFRAFRNFDGASHHFGDTSVQSVSSNAANVVVYVSTDSARPGRVVMVAINRSNSAQVTTVTGQPLSGTARMYAMTAASAGAQSVVQPVASGTQAASGSSITLNLPALSVTTVDIY